MDYQINRFIIEIPESDEKTSTDQLDMDFFLQRDYRKVILGTVRFPNGEPAPCSVVKIFKLKHPYSDAETTSELEPVAHAITDDNGQFLLGPLYPGEKLVLKIFYINGLVYEPSSKSVKGTCDPIKGTCEPMDTGYEEED